MRGLRVGGVRFVEAPREDVERGLLGWLSFELNESIRVDCCTLRRTVDDRLTVSFPTRRSFRGREYPVLVPVGDRARREIEKQILAALGLPQESPR
jgi:hypothetical protein